MRASIAVALLCSAPAARAEGEIPVTAASADARSEFLSCRNAYEGLRLAEAGARCAAALQRDPKLAWAQLIAALCASSTSERARGLDLALKLAAQASPCEKAWIEAAYAGHQGQQKRRLARLAEAARQCPGDWRPPAEVASLAYAQGDMADAASALTTAQSLSPPAAVYNLVGYVKARQGELEAAVAALRKAAELAPDQPNPHDSLGEIYLWAGRFADAESEFQEALALDPSFSSAWAGVGHALLFSGHIEDAHLAYKKVAESARRHADALFSPWWIAVAQLHEGKLDQARATLHGAARDATAWQAQGWAATFLLAAAQVEIESNLLKEAQATLQKVPAAVAGKDPGLARWRQAMAARTQGLSALILAVQGKGKQARAQMAAALKKVGPADEPQAARALRLCKGALELALGAADQAAADLAGADPDDPFVWYLSARALDKKGDKAGADALRDKIRRSNVNALALALARRKLAETSSPP